MLRDKAGHIINIGGGIEEQPDGSISITGTASAAHAVDWDAEG